MKTIVMDPEAADIALMLQTILPELSTVETYSDWASGWAAVLQQKPALVLVGLELEDFGGFALLESLEQMGIAVIALSEWATFAYEAHGCGAGFVLKPIENKKLEKAVKRAIARLPK